jgi:electron transport complex protein RnfG
VNTRTAPQIQINRAIAQYQARIAVFPEAFRFSEEIETEYINYFKVFDEEDELIGYTFIASEKGWSGGVIETMVGLRVDKSINRITILRHTETPGLGANATRAEFTHRFIGLSQHQLLIDRDGGNIVSITGSTVTTRAIVNSIRNDINLLIRALAIVEEDYDDLNMVVWTGHASSKQTTGVTNDLY